MAAFFNCVMLFSPSKDIGTHIGAQVREMEEKHAEFLEGREVQTTTTTKDESGAPISQHLNIYGLLPESSPISISVPTLHVFGTKDQFVEHSRTSIELCDAVKTEALACDIGHEIPRNEADVQKCVDLFEIVVMMASLST